MKQKKNILEACFPLTYSTFSASHQLSLFIYLISMTFINFFYIFNNIVVNLIKLFCAFSKISIKKYEK